MDGRRRWQREEHVGENSVKDSDTDEGFIIVTNLPFPFLNFSLFSHSILQLTVFSLVVIRNRTPGKKL